MGKKDKKKNDKREGLSAEELVRACVDNSASVDECGAENLRAMNDEELRKILALACDASHYLDLARRNQAEFDNYQKRMEKQRRDDARYAIVPLVREMLTSVDNLDRAIASSDKSQEFEPLFKGVGMTHQMLVQTLDKFGVKAIDPKEGEVFDPEFHEAMMTGTEDGKANDSVLNCFEKGWALHQRVIRPAKVRVNKVQSSSAAPDHSDDSSSEGAESEAEE